MQEVLLQKLAELEEELKEMYDDLDASDYTYYGQHVHLISQITKKSEEVLALKNGLNLIAAV